MFIAALESFGIFKFENIQNYFLIEFKDLKTFKFCYKEISIINLLTNLDIGILVQQLFHQKVFRHILGLMMDKFFHRATIHVELWHEFMKGESSGFHYYSLIMSNSSSI